MPNTGRPSRGCPTCRRRRIKCDLKLPACSQCVRKGHACAGYRSEFDMRLRIDNTSTFADNLQRDKRKRRDTTTIDSVAQIQSQTLVSLNVALYRPLAESWSNHMKPIVIANFSLQAIKGKESGTIFDWVPLLVAKAEEKTALFRACDTVAYAYMTKVTGFPNGVSRRMAAYSAALAAINSALGDARQRKSDSTLVCVYLLSVYEILSSETNNGFLSSEGGMHIQGMIELIRLRGSEQFTTRKGRCLFWIVWNMIQLHAASTDHECPKETLTWLSEMHKHCTTAGEYLMFRPIIFAYYCTKLCNRVRRKVQQSSHQPDDDLLASVPSILQDMDEIENTLPDIDTVFSSNPYISGYVIEQPLDPYSVPEYASPCDIGMLTYQYNFRMQLSSCVREFLQHAAQAPSCTLQQSAFLTKSQQRCATEYHAIVEKVFSLVGIVFGLHHFHDHDQQKNEQQRQKHGTGTAWPLAIQCLWPLKLIVMSSTSEEWQRDTAREVLGLISMRLGMM